MAFSSSAYSGCDEHRRHDGRIAVDRSNLARHRVRTDGAFDGSLLEGLEIGCDDGCKVRVAFALDCRDHEALAFVATTQGIKGEDVQDLMITAVEVRFGQINRLPHVIEWLTDNGLGTVATDTKTLARDIGLEPRTTPLRSPQSNGMAEAFVRTIKRDYARVSPRSDALTVIAQLPAWFEHRNIVHRH